MNNPLQRSSVSSSPRARLDLASCLLPSFSNRIGGFATRKSNISCFTFPSTMLCTIGVEAEAADYYPDSSCCKQIDTLRLLPHVCSALCPIAESMNYIAESLTSIALISRASSAKSVESDQTARSSKPGDTNTDERADDPRSDNQSPTSPTSESDARDLSRRSSSAKTKTVFRLAHPPPVIVHKHRFHIRPRILLQLQQLSSTARPRPVLDVLPSVVFAPRLGRLFPRTFKGKAGLGADDLVIVSSENYDTQEADARHSDDLFEDNRWDKREIVAAVCQTCQSRKDTAMAVASAEICFNSGTPWAASRLVNGAYEFSSTDALGKRSVARWVPKQHRSHWSSSVASNSPMSEDRKFTFSLLKSGSRRHAIIATLDHRSIEVSDRYSDPPASLDEQASTTPISAVSKTSRDFDPHGDAPDPTDKHIIEVDEHLRTLIIVTGIFVAFRDGFSPNFMYSDLGQRQSPPASNVSSHKHRSLSENVISTPNGSPESPKFGSQHRPRSTFRHTASSLVISPLAPGEPSHMLPRRTQSTGTAFIQRANNRSFSGNKFGQLSPIGDVDGRDAEEVSGQGRKSMAFGEYEHISREAASPLPRHSVSLRKSRPVSLPPPIATAYSPGTPESVPVVSAEEKPKRPSRLRKLFGFSKRASATA